ncbi:histone H2B [Gregarina niphandrodes]|uniref:Histone H2B n=1 Tax=Gregarina niphandrodes TaxID=110365 RepID=A0A023B4Z8_GRENI|nr:histone H2B [Gregarina niphandrodes]EZG57856.1 histone H2B [Gregarina niphandrodes]|eukprot:XP_011131022.1 histone H2B [Gregarina niphandrodes]
MEKAAASPTSTVASSTSPKKKKKKSPNAETYTSYIFKVLKQVRPNVKITKRAMSIMNSFVADTFERIASQAATLCNSSKKETLSSHEVHTAVRLVLPGDLAKYAVMEGASAVRTYTEGQAAKRPKKPTTTSSTAS